jgi:hypothetical protein
MHIGDLVRVKKPAFIRNGESKRWNEGHHGVILDILEGSDGFFDYEVLFQDNTDWFSDLELEVISERGRSG